MSKSKLQGYIFSRDFSGSFVPQRVQNLVIKNYVTMRGDEFLLSATEYGLKNCYMMLSALSKEMTCEGVVLYSVFLLPEDSELRENYLKLFISRGKSVHFALEGIVVDKLEELEGIHNIFFAQSIQSQIKEEDGYSKRLESYIK
ncbi:MAG: sporadic carbohydrate cluster protein (TIGR04323 family) [Bacteriovoracaceae bacterium]|jgi:sporadic carbohydrate cluster protein (TIGR04323 family)